MHFYNSILKQNNRIDTLDSESIKMSMKTSPLMPGLLLGVTSDTWPCQKLNDVRVSAPSCVLYCFILWLKRWKTKSLNSKFCKNKTSMNLTYYETIISFQTYIFGSIRILYCIDKLNNFTIFNCFSKVFINHVIMVNNFHIFKFY